MEKMLERNLKFMIVAHKNLARNPKYMLIKIFFQ